MSRRLSTATLGIAFACLALLVLLHARNPLDSDEGVVLNGAWNLLNGRALYFDFFEFVPPGSFYLVLGAWSLFGTAYWTAKVVGLVALALAAVGVYQTSHLLSGQNPHKLARAVPYASALLFCTFSGYSPAINHNTFHMPLAVWSTYFALRALQSPSWRLYATSGLLCGAGVWFLQHRAALIAATTLLFVCSLAFRSRDPNARGWTTAYLLGCLAPVALLAIAWPPSVLFEHLIVFPATRYLEVNRVAPTLIVLAATFTVSAACLLRDRTDAAIGYMLLLQSALLVTALQRPDLSHVTSALFPLLCLLPLLITAPVRSTVLRAAQTWTAAGLLFLCFPLMGYAWANPALFLADWSHNPAVQFVREHCGRSSYMYAGPFAPGLYFEARKLNPTRYAILLPNLHTDAQFAEARADLERHRPQCAATHYQVAQKFRYTKDNAVDTYLFANYQVVFEAGHLQVWMVRPETGVKPPVAAVPVGAAASP